MVQVWELYKYFSRNTEVAVYRTPNTITMVSHWPCRHVQIVLASWKDIQEVSSSFFILFLLIPFHVQSGFFFFPPSLLLSLLLMYASCYKNQMWTAVLWHLMDMMYKMNICYFHSSCLFSLSGLDHSKRKILLQS